MCLLSAPGINARVAELVDAQDLGSCVMRRVGSSPTLRTNNYDKEKNMNLNRYFGRDDIRFAKIVIAVAVISFVALTALL